VIEHYAERYADEFTSAEDLAAAARRRLGERIRRAGTRRCPVCGGLMVRRTDAVVCSNLCRVKRHREKARL
jgi:Ribonuclease G/E